MALAPTSSRGGSYSLIFDSTLSGAAANIDTGAGAIGSTFKHLRIIAYVRTAEAAVLSAVGFRFNADNGANYDTQRLSGRNAAASAVTSLAQTEVQTAAPGASQSASTFGTLSLDIPAYADTTGHKSVVSIAGSADAVAADGNAETRGHRWRNTAAITRVEMFVIGGSNLAAGSRLSVYGLS